MSRVELAFELGDSRVAQLSEAPDPDSSMFEHVRLLPLPATAQPLPAYKSAAPRRDATIQTNMTPAQLPAESEYFERALILRYLHLNKEQHRLAELFPKLSKDIGRQFYDGEF